MCTPHVCLILQISSGRPSSYYSYIVGIRYEQCDPSGCIYELSLHIMIIQILDQAKRIAHRHLWPLLWRKRQWRALERKGSIGVFSRCEQDYDLEQLSELNMHEKYANRIIQLGFVTIFAAAAPFAPLIAFIGNIIELRLDARGLVCHCRRPVAQLVSGIGSQWQGLIDFIAVLTVATNAAVLVIQSRVLPKVIYAFMYSGGKMFDGFVSFTLSSFKVTDFAESSNTPSFPAARKVDVCWYRGFYNDHDETDKYAFSPEFYAIAFARLAFVIALTCTVVAVKVFFKMTQPLHSNAMIEQTADGEQAMNELLGWPKRHAATKLAFGNESMTEGAIYDSFASEASLEYFKTDFENNLEMETATDKDISSFV